MPLLTVQGVEFSLVVVAMLWWKIVRDRRESQRRARALFALSAALSTPKDLVQGTIMANTEGYAYRFVGENLVRAPLVGGEADRDQAEPTVPATCPDRTPELVKEIARALQQAADDSLRGRWGTIRDRATDRVVRTDHYRCQMTNFLVRSTGFWMK